MCLPDPDVARRVERHETWSDVVHAATQAELHPESGAASLAVADGYAVSCGRRSPLNRASGLGMSGPVSVRDLDVLEGFYQEQGLASRVRVCPHADESLETLPAYRRQGVHAALIRARMVVASEAGCDLVVVHTVPGAPSQRNVLRAGFQLLYTTVEVSVPYR